MRACFAALAAILVLFIWPPAGVAAEKDSKAVITFELNNPSSTELAAFTERFKAADEHNRKVLSRWVEKHEDPMVFVLWHTRSLEVRSLYAIQASGLKADLEERVLVEHDAGRLFPKVIYKTDPHYVLAKRAIEEVRVSSSESVGMPQTPAVRELVQRLTATVSTRWPR
jgi:hypothetical protein